MIAAFTARAGRAMRVTALGVVGGVLMLTGLAFLTVAAWIALASALGTAIAALIIGGVYLLLSGAVFAIAAIVGRRPPPAPAQVTTGLTIATVAEAFIIGMTAARRRRDRS